MQALGWAHFACMAGSAPAQRASPAVLSGWFMKGSSCPGCLPLMVLEPSSGPGGRLLATHSCVDGLQLQLCVHCCSVHLYVAGELSPCMHG
jgi:hypothetical protein